MTVEAISAAPVPFTATLGGFGDRPALITAEGAVSYRDLARRVDEMGERLGRVRRLVLVEAANDVDTIVGYLAALRYGHPVLLAARESGAVEAMTGAYAPDVVVAGPRVVEHHPGSAHSLHPDLALLLSTSGSTGSPKLVRLSRGNVQSNAEVIATYLDIGAGDRAASTLPLHYCYGLSVIHSHLVRGAGVILTGLSVADGDFWDLFRREHGTTFAAVPYTFDLLDRVGFAEMDLPGLRYVTVAGGRLDPRRVQRYARLGESRGWSLVVMYGQTEATARMAYLPPRLAPSAPDAIGIPIPGGSLRIVAEATDPGGDVGELVYRGPNVMLGYAQTPADLALGRVVDELATGDLARLGEDGLYRIVGRRSRFLKLFGLRVDLPQVEAALAAHGLHACCAGDDDILVVAVEAAPTATEPDPVAVRRLVAELSGLPLAAVSVYPCPQVPRLASGKPDYAGIVAAARPADAEPPGAHGTGPRATAADPVAELVRLYATTLDRADVTAAHSFVDLGGDSLSYVETSIRLEQILGTLPKDWHLTPIADLAAIPAVTKAATAPPRRRVHLVDTSVLLRAVAIVLVVGTHVRLFGITGGAHMLLGVAGYNFARFQLTAASRRERARGIVRSVGRIAAATILCLTVVMLVTDQYSIANVFLLNNIMGSLGSRNTWHFWYIEDLVYFIVVATSVLSLGIVHRWERRWPFALPFAVMTLGLIARYQLVPGVQFHKTATTAWLFAIGWAAAKASTRGQRILLTAATAATVPGFFQDPAREAVIIGGLALLMWVPAVPANRLVTVVAGVLASASLYIYLVHWQVYMHIWNFSEPVAFVACVAAGIVYATVFRRISGYAAAVHRRLVQRRGESRRRRRRGLDAPAEAALN